MSIYRPVNLHLLRPLSNCRCVVRCLSCAAENKIVVMVMMKLTVVNYSDFEYRYTMSDLKHAKWFAAALCYAKTAHLLIIIISANRGDYKIGSVFML